jgi:hypothetical protein
LPRQGRRRNLKFMGHQFTIEGDEALALATQLATLRGKSLDTAVIDALRTALEVQRERLEFIAGVRGATASFRATLALMPQSADHGFLHDDETGLPA